jgi:hypothetical protein
LQAREHCAFARPIVSGRVLSLLIDSGVLRAGQDHRDVEIDRALTKYLFAQAGESEIKFSRVENIMRDRWHLPGEASGVPSR